MKLTRKTLIQSAVIGAIFLLCLVYPAQLFNGFKFLWQILLPLIFGGVMAYCINLLSSRIEKWLWPHQAKFQWARRPVALLLALVIIIAVIAGVLRLVIPEFISAVNSLFSAIPAIIDKANKWLANSDQASTISKWLSSSQINWDSIKEKLTKYLSSGASGFLSGSVSIFGSVFSGIFDFVLAFTFAIYLVAGKERIGGRLNRVANAFIRPRWLKKCRYVLHVTNQMFSSFIIGQVTEAIILGTLCTLGMLLFRFPDAVSIGALVGLSALIPMIGAWIGGIVGFVLIVISSPLQAVLFVVYIIILQQLEGNLIYPRVVGTSIGLPGILVLASITVGSGLGGIIGMLLAVPITATLYRLIRDATVKREHAKQAQDTSASGS